MFTLQQIQAAHAKVKSGADFPKYVQELITLGIVKYDCYVNDGHTKYDGRDNFQISTEAKYATLQIVPTSSIEKLKHSLKIHQQGQTDYLTFCQHSAEAGVEKWTVDIYKMTCTYYDKAGNEMVVEQIPQV